MRPNHSTTKRSTITLFALGETFITPGADPFSLFALAVPLYLLYEVSVAASFVIHRRRMRRLAADGIGVPA